MPLNKPYFRVTDTPSPEGFYTVTHNCNGNIDFPANDDIDEGAYRLILWALDEEARSKSREILKCLGVKP